MGYRTKTSDFTSLNSPAGRDLVAEMAEACAKKGLEISEYSPRKVKQAVVGSGAAQKDQVAKMVMRLLNLAEQPQEDAADALAIAICHYHQLSLPAEAMRTVTR